MVYTEDEPDQAAAGSKIDSNLEKSAEASAESAGGTGAAMYHSVPNWVANCSNISSDAGSKSSGV